MPSRKVLIGLDGRATMQGRAVFLSVLVITLSLSGCFGEEAAVATPEPEVEEQPRIFVTDRFGQSIELSTLEMNIQFIEDGETGKETSIVITSIGCI